LYIPPFACAGAVAVISSSLITVKAAEMVSKNTACAPVKFAPMIVTVAPPDAGTVGGDTDRIDGGSPLPRST